MRQTRPGKIISLRAFATKALLLVCAFPGAAAAQQFTPLPPPDTAGGQYGGPQVSAGDYAGGQFTAGQFTGDPSAGGQATAGFTIPSGSLYRTPPQAPAWPPPPAPSNPASASASSSARQALPWPPAEQLPYPSLPPSAVPPPGSRLDGMPGTQSVLMPSALGGRSVHLTELQEELPPGRPPPGVQPVPLPEAGEELPLVFEDCGCGNCIPGQLNNCPPCHARTRLGRFFCGMYRNVCCPDPCYDPHWWALADSAFFTGAPRPITQQRFRWDAGLNTILPDRAEYFWARSGGGGKGPAVIQPGLDYHDLSMYSEVASGKFSMFTYLPYRSVYPDIGGHTAGFSDIHFGVKSLLHDTELSMLTFQMTTFAPVGVPSRGLGTGHFSLEPSLIMGLNLSPRSYLQAQVAEWIPLGGNPTYAGALLHYHASYNRSLLGAPETVHLIGVMEFNGWSFQDGAYSSPTLGQFQPASGYTYVSLGPGFRVVLCDKLDFGTGTAFAVTSQHLAAQLIRTELRLRF